MLRSDAALGPPACLLACSLVRSLAQKGSGWDGLCRFSDLVSFLSLFVSSELLTLQPCRRKDLAKQNRPGDQLTNEHTRCLARCPRPVWPAPTVSKPRWVKVPVNTEKELEK
mmetsp:Transcript_11550/g.22721  ORF Transcript_11550/g.22721 Transcript_11550/m.22721 type:complete len:112 (-) Transcript_11550:74-409(-)